MAQASAKSGRVGELQQLKTTDEKQDQTDGAANNHRKDFNIVPLNLHDTSTKLHVFQYGKNKNDATGNKKNRDHAEDEHSEQRMLIRYIGKNAEQG